MQLYVFVGEVALRVLGPFHSGVLLLINGYCGLLQLLGIFKMLYGAWHGRDVLL